MPGAERGGRDRLSPRTRGALADLLGPGHPDAANARVTVAVTRVAQGDLTGALDDLLEAQAALDRFAREAVVRPLRVRARLLRGDTLRQLGRYEEAVDVLRSAQRMARHTELATEADNSLGVALRFLGDFAGAARAYARALASLPADDLASRAALHHNLAGLAHARGDHAASEAEARRALALRADAPRDPRYGGDLGALALAIAEQGRHEEALAVFAEALGIYEAMLPPSHPEVAYLLHNLGDTLVDAGRFAEATSAYDEALRVKEEALGEGHPEVAITLANSRLAYEGLGDREEAARRVGRAVAIVREALPANHPFRVSIKAIAADWPTRE